MSEEWTLMEFRPGRYVKVTSKGKVLGKAAESEIRAWFSAARSDATPAEQATLEPDAGTDGLPALEPSRSYKTQGIAREGPPRAGADPRQITAARSDVSTESEKEPGHRPEPVPEAGVPQSPSAAARARPRPEPLAEPVRDLWHQARSTSQRESTPRSQMTPRTETGLQGLQESAPKTPASAASEAESNPIVQPEVKPKSADREKPPSLAATTSQGESIELQPGGKSTPPTLEASSVEVPRSGHAPLPVQTVMPLVELDAQPPSPGSAPEVETEPIPSQVLDPLLSTGAEPASTGGAPSPNEELVAAADEAGSLAAELFRDTAKEPLGHSLDPEVITEEELSTGTAPRTQENEHPSPPREQTLEIGLELPLEEAGSEPEDDDFEDPELLAPPTPRDADRARATISTPSSARAVQDATTLETDPDMVEDKDNWLWVDPRYESGYLAATFDVAAFLQRAVALFQTKAWSGGRKPGRVMVHPEQFDDGLERAAEELGLAVLTDPAVGIGTFRLGAAETTAD